MLSARTEAFDVAGSSPAELVWLEAPPLEIEAGHSFRAKVCVCERVRV